MKKICCLLYLTLTFSAQCFAGEEIGTVRLQHGQYGANSSSLGKMFFFLDGGTKTNTPPCSTMNNGERWVIDNSWPAAQMQLSILLAAQMAGKRVHIRGSNDCGVWSDTETAIDILLLSD